MSKKKQFTALGQFLNQEKSQSDTDTDSEILAKEIKKNNGNENLTKDSFISTQNLKKQNIKTNKKDGVFVSWSTYIRPELEKQLKIKAVQEDIDIYKLLDKILSNYLKE